MNDTQRRFVHARNNARSKLIDPLTELINSAAAMNTELQIECAKLRNSLESLRPVWTEIPDGHAASVALAEIWGLLDAKNQTQAMENLREALGWMPVAIGKSDD